MNYFETKDKALCCGCRACASICPNGNIKMETDQDGFVYPVKSEECLTSCNLCVQVCPFAESESIKHEAPENCFAVTAPDRDLVFNSTSGGAFTILTNSFLKDSTDFVVFGAEMCSDLKVRHTSATTFTDCAKFRKSKYLKSEIGDSYIQARQALKNGKKVVFTGTPCQIAGLKKFLRKDYDNLFTMDIVCHGVPSQLHFDKYIEYLEKKYKSKVVGYQFRSKKAKKFGGGVDPLSIKVEFENGKKVEINENRDYFMTAFLKDVCLMEACHSCKYATTKRVSDITIADFWGIENYSDKFSKHLEDKAVSLVIVNSQKGQNVWEHSQKGECFETKLENAVKGNSVLIRPNPMTKERARFLLSVRDCSFDNAVKMHVGKPGKLTVRGVVSKIIPKFAKNFIRKIIRH